MGNKKENIRFTVSKNKSDVDLLGGKEMVYEQIHEDFDKRLTEAKYKANNRKKVKG